MADVIQPAADAATTPAPADASAQPTPTTTPTQPAPAKPVQNPEQPFVNKQEFVDFAREFRDFKKDFKDTITSLRPQAPAPAPEPKKPDPAPANQGPDPMAEINKLRGELALKDAITDAGLGKYRAQIERVWRNEQPKDIGPWLADTSPIFGWKKDEPTPPPAPPPAEPAKPEQRPAVALPAPSIPGGNALPELNKLTREKAMELLRRGELREVVDRGLGVSSGGNYVAEMKRQRALARGGRK